MILDNVTNLPVHGPRSGLPLAALQSRLGTVLGHSRWIAVPQAMIDAFGHVTHDLQPLHVDPAAAAATAFGAPIAHGFLTLSLLSVMAYDAVPSVEGSRVGVNYGFDRIRFLAPVPAGARLRGRFELAGIEQRDANAVLMRLAVLVEIEGAARPALAADWLTLSLW